MQILKLVGCGNPVKDAYYDLGNYQVAMCQDCFCKIRIQTFNNDIVDVRGEVCDQFETKLILRQRTKAMIDRIYRKKKK